MTPAVSVAWLLMALRAGQVSADPVMLSVDDAVRIGIQRSFAVAQARSTVRKTKAQIDQAKGGLGPRFTVGGNYTRYDRATATQGGAGSIDSKTANAVVSIVIDVSGVVGLGVRAARIYSIAAEEQIAVATNQVKNDVRTAYFNVVRLQSVLATDESALANARRRLQIGQQQFNVGQVAKFDVVRLQTEVTRLEAAVIQDQTSIIAAKQNLNLAMSRPVETPIEVAPVDVATITVPTNADELAQLSESTRPELRAAGFQVDALGIVVQGERKGLSPTLTVSAGANHNFDPGAFQRSNSGQLSATINWPIFDSGITRARVKAAQEDQIRAQLQKDQLSLSVSLQVRQALIRMTNAREQVRLANQQVEQAREALRIADLLFETGKGILLDTTTAQENLTRAETSLSNAQYEYLIAEAELQYAVGKDDLPGLRPRTTPTEGN